MRSAPQPFAVAEILANAFRHAWGARRDLLSLALLPIVALALLQTFLEGVSGGALIRFDPEGRLLGASPAFFILAAAEIVFFTMFSTAWCRRCLYPEENPQISILAALMWNRDKTIFLFRFILLSFVTAMFVMTATFPLALLLGRFALGGGAVLVAAVAVAVLIVGRGALILPAAAVGDPTPLMELLLRSRGYVASLALIVLVPNLAFALLQALLVQMLGLIGGMLGAGDSMTLALVSALVERTVGYAGIAVWMAALAAAYRRVPANSNRGGMSQ